VGELKLAGILCQIVVDNLAIVGVGLNLDFPDHDRPSPRATALAHQGVAVESALDAILRDFIKGLMTWLSTPEAEKLSAAKTSVEECLDTIGRVVEVRETSGWKWRGEALGLDPAGHLLVRPEHESEPVAVASSDIEHLYQ
jgi:biotin-(acetyl-CoA carboxylase) ligase